MAHPPAVPTNLHVRAAISKELPISKLTVTKNGLPLVNLKLGATVKGMETVYGLYARGLELVPEMIPVVSFIVRPDGRLGEIE